MGQLPEGWDAFVERVEQLGQAEIAALARRWQEAEASRVSGVRRAMARHLALLPDTPGVIDVLSAQLTVSEAAAGWPAPADLSEMTCHAAAAAALDMALTLSCPGLSGAAVSALAGPWLERAL